MSKITLEKIDDLRELVASGTTTIGGQLALDILDDLKEVIKAARVAPEVVTADVAPVPAAPPEDPVHKHEGAWWYWDEAWADRHGPFTSRTRAEIDFAYFMHWLNTGENLRPPPYLWLKLGSGAIEVGEGFDAEGVPAFLFGKNGGGVVGAPTTPGRYMREDETLAVVSFANVESLDVVLGQLLKCRRDRFSSAETDMLLVHKSDLALLVQSACVYSGGADDPWDPDEVVRRLDIVRERCALRNPAQAPKQAQDGAAA